ncbi:MAG: TonB-dependent receptor family protein [Dysgonamonadaceae bacterium]|nr:TonB-dependent receptor family protein [Dysgonamonadaceae bacterium]
MDTDNSAIVAGNVELLAAKDSSFVYRATSNTNGDFSFRNIEASKYLLKVTYVGYKTFFKDVNLDGSRATTNLGVISLAADAILLSEAVIEGKRPEIVVKNDTLEYDAASYKTPQNSVVEDLLKKLPGAEVDDDGNVKIGGKDIKGILVDGKNFFDDPQIATKNLPADMVEKLQVFDRKSDQSRMTGFDDGEEQTYINLTIRKGMKNMTTGTVQIAAGQDVQNDNDKRYLGRGFLNGTTSSSRYTFMIGTNNNNNMGAADQTGGGSNNRGGFGGFGGSGTGRSQNYMLGINKEFSPQLNLNGDIRYNKQERSMLNKSETTTLSQNLSQLDKSLSNSGNFSDNVAANLNLEWKPNDKQELIFRPNASFNTRANNGYSSQERYDYNNMDPLVFSQRNSASENTAFSISGNLSYAYRFSRKAGRVLSINARGNYSDNNSQGKNISLTQNYINGIYASDENRNQRSENDNYSNGYRANLSFVEPIGHNNLLQFAYRISYSDSKALNSTYDIYEALWSDALDTAIIKPSQSRSALRNSTEQRIGVSFKAVREKYNFTLGFNADPSKSVNDTYQPKWDSAPIQYIPRDFDGHIHNFQGDSLISSIPLNVINFSPVVSFNYLFGQRTNLRINYEGETNQPSANQLQDYEDTSDPINWSRGNPNLKPGYSNQLRASFNKFIAATQMMYGFNLNGRFSFNDIVSVTQMLDGGKRMTTYENVNGNWNFGLSSTFNTPLKNKKITIGNSARLSLGNENSYSDAILNAQKDVSLTDMVSFNYRSSLFDIGLNTGIIYRKTTNAVNTSRNQETNDYRLGGNTVWYFPHDWTIDSDINWLGREGYGQGYNIAQTLWNAAVAKQLFNKKYGVGTLKLQIFDILQNRNSITASPTTNGFQTRETNVIPSYFLCSFIYRFNIFPNAGTNADQDNSFNRRDRDREGDGGGNREGGNRGRGGTSGGGRGGRF